MRGDRAGAGVGLIAVLILVPLDFSVDGIIRQLAADVVVAGFRCPVTANPAVVRCQAASRNTVNPANPRSLTTRVRRNGVNEARSNRYHFLPGAGVTYAHSVYFEYKGPVVEGDVVQLIFSILYEPADYVGFDSIVSIEF